MRDTAATAHPAPSSGMTREADVTPVPIGGATTAAAPPDRSESAALRLALMESRQRWRQFGAIACDLAFETDGFGQITFLAPEFVLGQPASALLGQPARALLADDAAIDPFHPSAPVHRRHIWLRTAAGLPQCMALSMVPMLDEAGRPRGLRGVGVNVTEEERAATAAAAALRRGEVLGQILARMRQEVLAPRTMRAILESVMLAFGAAGAAVLDMMCPRPPLVLHEAGSPIPPHPELQDILATLADDTEIPRCFDLQDGTQLLACTCSTRFGERAALLAWRPAAARAWDPDDLSLGAAVAGIVRITLEHETIQRELARQARTDPLTGLLNRRAFMDEASRRLDRLERDGLPGTLLFVDLDRLKHVNDQIGHEAGDSALVLTAALLTRTFRPGDLVARLGGDEFAVWLDGADSLTAAERAEDLRIATPIELAHLTPGDGATMGMSIGIAMRRAGSDETLDQVMHRADQAMYEVKRAGRGHWRVSQLAQAR